MTTSYDTMQRLKALFSPRSRRGGPGAGFTSLSVDSLHSDASSTISAPIRARFQKKEKTPVLIRISPSPESTPSATPLPSPALTAQIDPNDPFADPIEHVSTTKIANTSYDLSTFGRITIEATANTPQITQHIHIHRMLSLRILCKRSAPNRSRLARKAQVNLSTQDLAELFAHAEIASTSMSTLKQYGASSIFGRYSGH